MRLTTLLSKINNLIPKSNTIIFNSYPPYSDNSLALFNYICENRPDITSKYRILWGQETVDISGVEASGTISPFIKKTPKGIWYFLRARYVISTHGYFPGVKSGHGQVQCNLWHGCGYKSITNADHMYRGDETIVTSEIYKTIHSRVLQMKQETVHITGLPRNDTLYHHHDVLPKLGLNKEQKIIIWMPTYRKAALGHDGIDGSETSFSVATISDDQMNELNNELKKQNSTLIVKPHPMDTIAVDRIKGYSNIVCLTNQELKDKGVDLYELLSCTDGLLSDYSSVIIDYLLLDKSIVMVLSDQEEYKESRGFVFDPVEDFFPGPIINDFSGLINYFAQSDQIDRQWTEKRQELKALFHKYTDDKACERVCNLIWGEKS